MNIKKMIMLNWQMNTGKQGCTGIQILADTDNYFYVIANNQ